MKQNKRYYFLAIILALLALSSCSSVNTSMREANVIIEFDKADFELSETVSGEASSTKVLGVDWERLFNKKEGLIDGSTSIFGAQPSNACSRYALHQLMSTNPGYDVIFYPQYEISKKSYILFSKTSVKTSAKLGKIIE